MFTLQNNIRTAVEAFLLLVEISTAAARTPPGHYVSEKVYCCINMYAAAVDISTSRRKASTAVRILFCKVNIFVQFKISKRCWN